MPAPRQPAQLADILTFHPEWWTDPVPPWLLQGLERGIQIQLVTAQLEAHAQILQLQADVARKSMEILQQVK
jgi:hypothetical protein